MKNAAENVRANTKITKKDRDISLDAVKGFAILLVMLGHCIVLNGLADPFLYDAIAAVQMPLFMAVSGYLAGLHQSTSGQKPDLKKRIRTFGKRSVTYLVPFFTWMIIVSFPHCLQELKTELFHLDYGLWFLATLWIITLVHTVAAYLADYAAYTIRCGGVKPADNMDCRAVGTMSSRIKAIRFLAYCMLIFICYAVVFLQARGGNTFLSPSLTVRYLPFFVAAYLVSYDVIPYLRKRKNREADDELVSEQGAYITEKNEIKKEILTENDDIIQEKKLDPNKYVISNILCMICAFIFIYLVCAYDMVVVTDTTTLMAQMLASFLGVYVCFYGVAHFCKGWLQRALAYIGQYTLEIYVLHFRFARILGLSDKNLKLFHPDTVLWILASFVLMSILTAVFISALKQLWITDLLCFGKIRSRRKKQTSQEAEIP